MATKIEIYNDQFVENVDAHKLISKVDLTKDRDTNLAVLLGTQIKKDPLKKVIAYLVKDFALKYPNPIQTLSIKKHNLTKDDYYNMIINFVEVTLPYLCLKCQNDYLPYSQEDGAESDVKCFVCKIPSHAKCIKTDDVNIETGIVFVCQTCMQNQGKATVLNAKEAETELSGTSDSSSGEDSSDEEKTEEGSWTEKKKKSRKKKTVVEQSRKKDQPCPMLIEGVCPHGLTGKTCEYIHNKVCSRYSMYGSKEMHRWGCRFGERCRYVHVTLCNNSIEMGMC